MKRYRAWALCLALLSSGLLKAETITANIITDYQMIPIKAEVADTPSKREKGLMDVKHLPTHAGMLFVFEKPEILHFWMKNTLIPLDLIFIDRHDVITKILTMTPCKKMPCPLYSSATPTSLALEVNAHFCRNHEVHPGDLIKMDLKKS